MRVKRLQLTNFRGFESLDLDLDHPLTVLVGRNGSGKSSLLHGLTVACGALPWERDRLVRTLDEQDIRAGHSEASVLAEFSHQGQDFTGHVELTAGRTPIYSRGAKHRHPGSLGQLFAVLLDTSRGLQSAEVRAAPPPRAFNSGDHAGPHPWQVDDDSMVLLWPGFDRFVSWFKEREDVENEQRVASGDLTLQDPQLKAVREAIAELMPGFTRLRIQRSPGPVMVITKDGTQLRLDQLSDGERNLIALTGDLARRMALSDPQSPSPRELEGVVMIDEIEQHLHPGLQREVLPRLRRAFPNAQFIVTTHSPQVLSTAPRDAIVEVDQFTAYRLEQGAEGRDSNAILDEVFRVSKRPQKQLAQIDAVRGLIDDGQIEAARLQLDTLAALVSEQDEDVLALRMRLFVADAGQEPLAAPEASEGAS
jgi:predicted ATPase